MLSKEFTYYKSELSKLLIINGLNDGEGVPSGADAVCIVDPKI